MILNSGNKKFFFLVIFASFLILFTTQEYGFSQENANQAQIDISNNKESSFFHNGGLSTEVNPFWTPEQTTLKAGLRYSILVGFPAVHIAYGFFAWDWGTSKSWRWGRERWFQGDTDSGGADKAGHFFAHHLVTRLSYSVFSYTEKDQNMALAYSAITGATCGLLIEIGDAFTGRYGFSYEDLVADLVGVSAAVILDKYPVADEFIGITAEYWPSKAFRSTRKSNDKHIGNFAGDYSGWKYLLNFKLAGFKYIGFDIPEFMRYIQLDFAYYTKNYTDYDMHYRPGGTPKRHYSFGVSVNMREVTKDIFKNYEKASWVAEQPFKYIHVPVGYRTKHTI